MPLCRLRDERCALRVSLKILPSARSGGMNFSGARAAAAALAGNFCFGLMCEKVHLGIFSGRLLLYTRAVWFGLFFFFFFW